MFAKCAATLGCLNTMLTIQSENGKHKGFTGKWMLKAFLLAFPWQVNVYKAMHHWAIQLEKKYGL